MGLSYGQTSGETSGASSTSNKYSSAQSGLQDQIGSTLASNLAAANGGTLSPGVTAMKTQAADQINKTAGGLTDRVTQFLAQRGFGKSGQTGQASLQGELGRESQIGNNEANFAGQQSNLNTSNLLAALNYAFSSLGTSGTTSGTSSGTSFGAQASGAFAF